MVRPEIRCRTKPAQSCVMIRPHARTHTPTHTHTHKRRFVQPAIKHLVEVAVRILCSSVLCNYRQYSLLYTLQTKDTSYPKQRSQSRQWGNGEPRFLNNIHFRNGFLSNLLYLLVLSFTYCRSNKVIMFAHTSFTTTVAVLCSE